MKKTEKITFRTTPELKKQIAALAEYRRISNGKLIHKWLEMLIQNQIT